MRKSVHLTGQETAAGCLSVYAAPPVPAQARGSCLASGGAITLYAAWNARSLLGAWLHSPFDRCGSLAFLLWIVPVASLWIARRRAKRPGRLSSAAFAIALLVSFTGVAMDLGVLKYLGLAIAIAGFLPVQRAMFAWLGCCAVWMPAAGWAFSSHGPLLVNAARLMGGVLAILLTPLFWKHESLR